MYTKVDISTWKRRELFKLYTGELPLVMNMTVDIDVTKLYDFAKSKGLRFYPVMMWIVSKIINSREEFRLSRNEDGELIRWDRVSPSYTDFNPETEEFVKFVTENTEDLYEFHDRVVKDCEKHKNQCGFLPNQPKNIFDISCLPWVKYNSLTLHVGGGYDCLFPVVIWGKFEEENGRKIMPVTMNINHAVADGFHLCRFFTDLKAAINEIK